MKLRPFLWLAIPSVLAVACKDKTASDPEVARRVRERVRGESARLHRRDRRDGGVARAVGEVRGVEGVVAHGGRWFRPRRRARCRED